jgi:hypothetical protein
VFTHTSQLTLFTFAMSVTLAAIIAVVIALQVTSGPLAWVVNQTISRVLEFIMSAFYLGSVGASSFKKLCLPILSFITSSRNTADTTDSKGADSNGTKEEPTSSTVDPQVMSTSSEQLSVTEDPESNI